MTIQDLRKIIKDLPGDMKIGASGHFGEYLECSVIEPQIVSKGLRDNEKMEILSFSIESPGDEPD